MEIPSTIRLWGRERRGGKEGLSNFCVGVGESIWRDVCSWRGVGQESATLLFPAKDSLTPHSLMDCPHLPSHTHSTHPPGRHTIHLSGCGRRANWSCWFVLVLFSGCVPCPTVVWRAHSLLVCLGGPLFHLSDYSISRLITGQVCAERVWGSLL